MQVAVRALVPMPPGLSECTFDAAATLQGGVLMAAGPLAAHGQQYPVALILRCRSPGGVCADSYLAVYNYSTATRTLRWVMIKLHFRGTPTMYHIPPCMLHSGQPSSH